MTAAGRTGIYKLINDKSASVLGKIHKNVFQIQIQIHGHKCILIQILTTLLKMYLGRGVDPYGTGGHVPPPIFGLGDRNLVFVLSGDVVKALA